MKKLVHFLKLAWSVSPSYLIILMLNAICESAKSLLNVILPMFLINELTDLRRIEVLVFYAGLIVLNNVGMTLLTNIGKRFSSVKDVQVQEGMMKLMSEKIMNLEYSYLENPVYLDLKERAVFAINNQNAIANMIYAVAEFLSKALTLIGLVSILITLGPVLIIVLAISIVLVLLIYNSVSNLQAKVMQEIVPINRRFGYYFGIAMDKGTQKDIRLYNMEKMITERIVKFSNETCDLFENMQIKSGQVMGQIAAISEGVAAFSYGYVGIRTVSTILGPQLTLGALTMYVSAAINFSAMVTKFGEGVVMMMQFMSFLDPYMEFMSLAEETKQTGKIPFTGEVETVEFRNVTFTYPNAEKAVLKNVSFAIHKGEKISIVGLNGAGKSTLVKLICRMYQADSGEILVNGKNIYDYEYLSYMNTISAVFQDYRLFNFTIEENIACEDVNSKCDDVAERKDTTKSERIEQLIDEVGLREKIDELPHGVESRFGKEYDEDGIEMSGGQGQKIAIARALYKKASMVILDEPASALDPIAEAEIYEKFNSLVEDKTAIYISHRMSSSVFCDRILIIDGGTVADFDTHENLMKKTESLYYKLFMSQAENYKLEEA
ncbi:MAG: ABC transporter ATP-binding protein [Agathobacter sp.]|nr:ABC transporter ATP-binding protein [Agathobacter sp.]